MMPGRFLHNVQTVFIGHHDLARLYITHKLCAAGVKGTRFGSKHVGALPDPADHQRAEPVRIARSNEFLRAHDDQRK